MNSPIREQTAMGAEQLAAEIVALVERKAPDQYRAQMAEDLHALIRTWQDKGYLAVLKDAPMDG